ncbi:MAG TPA: efflux RND transporter periplasmic adaptor subunit [Bryobacteraceae bacterium]|nr:efflux RND transporter periplasmic adaptor subunit [Bryobacteraceae bacterium]
MKQHLVLIAILTAACGSKPAATTTSASENKPVAISTAVAQSREVPADFEETGTFTADEQSDIAPLVAGRVISTPVDVGAEVKAGQIICELDHRDAELRLEQVRAQMEEANASVRQARSRIGLRDGTFDPEKVPEVAAARANYESAQASARLAGADAQRYANLVATGDVSRSAYEKARTAQETAEAQVNAARQQYEAAVNNSRQQFEMVSTSQASSESMRAQLAQAEKALADTTIRAPFDGFITARPVASGEYVALTSKIATLVRIGSLKLELQTPEQRASQAHVGDAVTARVSAYPDRTFPGRVSAINQSVDPNSRIFILIARFDNPDAALKPGMFATARVRLPGATQGIFIPRVAVTRDKTTDSNQVFVIQNGRSRLRVVSLGDTDGDMVRLLTGVSAGETVATSNQIDLYDGALITANQVATR